MSDGLGYLPTEDEVIWEMEREDALLQMAEQEQWEREGCPDDWTGMPAYTVTRTLGAPAASVPADTIDEGTDPFADEEEAA